MTKDHLLVGALIAVIDPKTKTAHLVPTDRSRIASLGTTTLGCVFVLAIDTSSPAVTAAVVTVGESDTPAGIKLLAARGPIAARGHGELLVPAIADCLREAGLGPSDIGAAVAGTGPGPFTGLRVGLVTAAAFADAIGVPTYGVCSLDAIGGACADESALLVATDARRREVYWAGYEHGRRVSGPAVDRPVDVPTAGVSAVAGAAGELYREVWPEPHLRREQYPDPIALVRCAADRIVRGSSAEVLTPLYLRRPDAIVPGAPKAVTR